MLPSATHSKRPTFADTPAPGALLSFLSSSPLLSRWDYLFLNGIPLIYHVNAMASTSQLLESSPEGTKLGRIYPERTWLALRMKPKLGDGFKMVFTGKALEHREAQSKYPGLPSGWELN